MRLRSIFLEIFLRRRCLVKHDFVDTLLDSRPSKDIRWICSKFFESLGDYLTQGGTCSVPLLDVVASIAIDPSRSHGPRSEILNCFRSVQSVLYLVLATCCCGRAALVYHRACQGLEQVHEVGERSTERSN